MAQKRMFSKDVTNSDIFLDMPLSSQCLYFHLGMNADDDGFVQPRSIIRLIQAKDDDLKILVAKGFCIVFADSVVVITHRKQNNQIQKDRYKPSVYQEHMKALGLLPNKEYKLLDTKWIQNGYKMDTQYSIEENSKDKSSIEEKEKNTKKENIDDFEFTLLEFKKMRNKIKKPMTDNAVELLKKELEKLAPGSKELQIAIMNKSIMNCWQGVFALKDDEIKNATDPIITQYEEQVKICFEKGRADDRENQILTEKRKELESKYGEEKGGEIRKNIRSKYK